MAGATTHQQQQAPQLAQQQQAHQLAHPSSSSSKAQTTTPEEDELLKRNTDCVYFLASPLTCKKGSECEYRHSDIARVNPRDCWYWLNGNCLNPKCPFRHPPLDGLLGSEDVSAPMGPPVPAPHAAPYAMPKQGVACIFFQKGFCLKGHLCPFLHGPSSSVNSQATQPGPAKPVTEPPKIAEQVTVESMLSQGKHFAGNGVVKKIAPPSRVVPPPVMSLPPAASNKPNRGKDADEYSREPSPGFDVLVDNEIEDSGHDYDGMYSDRERQRERDHGRYNEQEVKFHHRPYPRNARENESDLRHRLSKQRRGEGMPRDSRHHHRLDQGTLSSRLRGRIKIPRRSVSPTKENSSRVEREIDTERRHLSRYSPGRPLSLDQSRLRDRARITDTKFAGPKRLSELKGVRTEHQSTSEQFPGKRKYMKIEEDLSFEGPKPLSEILKRKRGVTTDNNNHSVSSANLNIEDGIDNKETEMMPVNEDENSTVPVELEAGNENDKQVAVDSVTYGATEVENEGEDGLIDEDALLDEELEAYDETRDGDYEYEQMEGEEEDYNLDEYVDEEYGDEGGKKEGVENNEF